ncbi:MAG: hypothetical protein HN337_01985 [Deltaproteobacteria bacterium]|nr:hypothetical protein [Deltaproteobacteria bacterium]
MKKAILSIFLIFSFLSVGGCVGDSFVMGKLPSGDAAPDEVAPPEGLPNEGGGGSGETTDAPASYLAIQKITTVPQDGSETEVVDFVYQEGRLAEIKRVQPTTGTAAMLTKEGFNYDDEGRLIELQRYKGSSISGGVLNERYTYEYDEQGRLKKQERYAGPDQLNTNSYEYAYDGNTCTREQKVWDSSNGVWVESSDTTLISFNEEGLPVVYNMVMSAINYTSEQGYDGQRLNEVIVTKVLPPAPFSNRTWRSDFSFQGAVANLLTQEMVAPDYSGDSSPKKCWIVTMDSFSAESLIYKESIYEIDALCDGWDDGGNMAGGEMREVEFENMSERPFMPPMNLSEFTPGHTLLMADDATLIYGKWIDSF